MNRLARKRKRNDATLSQVGDDVMKRVCSLGPRCDNCQVPIKAFKNLRDFGSHRAGCKFVPSLKTCYAGVLCQNLTIRHYEDYSHLEISRLLLNCSLLDIKPSPVSLAEPIPDTPLTPSRNDTNNNRNNTQVKQEITPVSVKKENRFKSPMATPSSARKRGGRKAKYTDAVDAKQRTLLEFYPCTPSPKTPKREGVEFSQEPSQKEFPLKVISNFSSRLAAAGKDDVQEEKNHEEEREKVVSRVEEVNIAADEVIQDLQAFPDSMETEAGDFVQEIPKEPEEEEVEEESDVDLFENEAEETRLSEAEEDEDEELFQRVETESVFEEREVDVVKEVERFEKLEKSKAAWSSLFAKQKEKVKSVQVESVVQLTVVKQLANGKFWSRPAYKVLRGTRIAVDCFNFGDQHADVDYYFLTHFHSDHYQGLTKAWTKPIYCSRVTGNLVIHKLRIPEKLVVRLDMNQPTDVEMQSGQKSDFKVTLLDANHCPGAVLFLFECKDGRRILHTGDFRADTKMESYPELWNVEIDYLYLDTTYFSEEYDFPRQDEVIKAVCDLCEREVRENPRTLFVCGSYCIGKERVWVAIAELLKLKVWVQADKKNTVKWLEDKRLNATLGKKVEDCRIHVVPMGSLSAKKLKVYLASLKNVKYSRVVGIKPTGWTFKSGRSANESIVSTLFKDRTGLTIYGVPYSEHSSYGELRRFVQFFCPKSVIATVGKWQDRKEYETVSMDWVKEAKMKKLKGASKA